MLYPRNTPQHNKKILSHSKSLEKEFQPNGPKKQTVIDILISIEIDIEPKFIKRDEKGHCIFMKGKIPLDDI